MASTDKIEAIPYFPTGNENDNRERDKNDDDGVCNDNKCDENDCDTNNQKQHQQTPPQQIPVTILTGFLGSGKTTLLNHILRDQTHGMKFAIIENEFGEVGVDEELIFAGENVGEELIEVMNGCICCTVRGDLIKALKNLYVEKRGKFDSIIIETTGLADPAPVCQTFFMDDDIKNMYKLDCVVTVVDAMHILERLREEKPEGVENEAVEQVCFSDKILLNKVDLVKCDKDNRLDEIERELHVLNPSAPIQRTLYGKINPKDILNVEAFELKRVLEFDPEFLDEDQEHQHDATVSSVAVKVEGEVNISLLESWIRRLIMEDGANLYRYKGVIAVKDMNKKFVFQGVGMTFLGEFDKEFHWKENEVRESRFIFIGKHLDHKFYREGFLKCLTPKEGEIVLRFPVGTVVEVNIGVYQQGTVLKQWDKGNAYLIEVEGPPKTNVWAPIDHDVYIRSVGSPKEYAEQA